MILLSSLMDVVSKSINKDYEDINSTYKNTYNYLKNIFSAFGVSLRQFNRESDKKRITYNINDNLANILAHRIKSHNFPKAKEIKNNIENNHTPDIEEYCRIVNQFLECNFNDYDFQEYRYKIKRAMEELIKSCENEAKKYSDIANSIRDNIILLIRMDIFESYNIDDFFDELFYHIFSFQEQENESGLSERSVAIIRMVSLKELINLERKRLKILHALQL